LRFEYLPAAMAGLRRIVVAVQKSRAPQRTLRWFFEKMRSNDSLDCKASDEPDWRRRGVGRIWNG
jgi:hypothetical protein